MNHDDIPAYDEFKPQPMTPMAEINMIPLIDVMLVLLVFFILTTSLPTHEVKIDLPTTSSATVTSPAATVDLAIDAHGALHWNGESVTHAIMTQRLADLGVRTPLTELHVRAAKDTRYQTLAEVLSSAQNAGVTKIAFIVANETLPQSTPH